MRLRVMVIGGGPAGMHAARFLGLQGHDVALHEATGRLGGQLHYLRQALPEYGTLVDWLALELAKVGVTVELGRPVGVEEVRDADPDVVVVATGARGGYLWADQSQPTIPRFDILSALERPDDQWEKEVAVLGGDYAACVVALHLRRLGVRVNITDSGASLATDGEFNGLLVEIELDADPGVHIYRETTAEVITGDRVAIETRGVRSLLQVGAVVDWRAGLQ